MDWKTLFLSAQGRIGKKDFWIGFGILFVANMLISQIHAIAWLWSLASIYFGVCVGAKRLHDIGKSAWLVLAPIGIMLAAYALAAILGGAAFLGLAATGSDTATVLGGLAGLGLAGLVVVLGMLASLGAVLWVGVQDGDAGDNRFGPPRDVPLVTAV
jgi:uncharacterized membrane protein YhaH (DUF805 family)